MEDLYAILGVPPGASPEELTAAFRALAKQSHPDTAGDTPATTARMAEINAAYDSLRSGRWGRGRTAPDGGEPAEAAAAAWLAQRIRSALGRELLDALEHGESVQLVTPASSWSSPRTLLAVTDRRLLWLNDDAVLGRVRSLRFRDIAAADVRLSWPRRRRASVKLRAWNGRRLTFSGLRPAFAQQIAQAVASGGGY